MAGFLTSRLLGAHSGWWLPVVLSGHARFWMSERILHEEE